MFPPFPPPLASCFLLFPPLINLPYLFVKNAYFIHTRLLHFGVDLQGGLYRRTLTALFELRDGRRGVWDYRFRVSVIEIYNENAFDLLDDDKRYAKVLSESVLLHFIL